MILHMDGIKVTVLQSDSTTKWQYYNQTVLLCAITTEDLCCYQLSPPPAGLKPHLLLLPPVSSSSSSLYSINQGSLDWHINRPGAVLPSPPSLIHWLSEWLPYTPKCTSRSASYLKNIITTSFGSHQKEVLLWCRSDLWVLKAGQCTQGNPGNVRSLL